MTKPSVPLPTGPAHPNAENLKAVLKERFETIAEAFAFFDRNGSWMLTKHHVRPRHRFLLTPPLIATPVYGLWGWSSGNHEPPPPAGLDRHAQVFLSRLSFSIAPGGNGWSLVG